MSRNDFPGISHVVANYLCHSCGACLAVCKHDAISYHETTGGYLFPQVNSETCTRCGLCYEVCSGHRFGKTLKTHIPSDPFVGEVLSCEVGRASDDAVFSNGQSGGVATALLTYLFESKQIEVAIVAAMQTTVPPRGEVHLVKSVTELSRMQKSKYVPITLLTVIERIESVKGGVAIVGLPCHFHSLCNLLDLYPSLAKKNFFKIGLICDRVMTTTAIDFMVSKATAQAVNHFVFRDKAQPSYPGNPVVGKEDGSFVVLNASLRMMIKDFFTPARCRLCFDKLNVFADVVLGDPHGVPDVDRVHGETLVFSRTIKGQVLIEEAKKHLAVELRSVDVKLAIEGQGIKGKRENWAAFMRAWEGLDRQCPDYGLAVPQAPLVPKYRKWIKHALALDGFVSRDALFSETERWLVKQKVMSSLMWPARKVKSILKRIN